MMAEPSKGESVSDDAIAARPAPVRSLASKFSLFTAALVFCVAGTIFAYDFRQNRFDATEGVLLFLVVLPVAGAISWFMIRQFTRPLGESFNRMTDALAVSEKQIREQQELLERNVKDRTEQLEQATRTAQAASQAKSEFLANISHELRTPLNGVIGMLDIALDQDLNGELAEQLQTAQHCAHSLLSLLNDILDLSKIEAGKMTLETIPFDVRALMADCIKAHQPKAQENSVALLSEVSPNVPQEIIGDPLRIRQILANLISNAVKFTEHGSVAVRMDGQFSHGSEFTLRFTVEDSGTGIPADKLLYIFDQFTQADGSVSRKYGGTGLGLAITRKLVELHRGEINVNSELGRGTAFTVTLQCEARAAVSGNPGASTAPGSAASRAGVPDNAVRILVVEDNQVNQKVVTAVLRKRGFYIELANDGQEALNKLYKSAAFDLILMDVQMPVLDGLEATRLIRKEPRWKQLPIIAMTAHAMNGDKERCLEAGMSGYISKPVHPSLLLSTVDEFLLQKTS
jgi:signal transduction histidine kinase